ncbi:MAG TPA: hypothetical protein VFT22_35500 [Kofleriaceae bacterium]|nr:hypothetical protein [Kofleriaceae bacterium]
MFTLTRGVAILSVMLLKTQARHVYMSVFIGVLFAHYVLSIWYARRKLKPVVRMQVPALAIGLIAGASIVLPIVAVPSLVIYFGFHHALTEGYMLAGRRGGANLIDRPATHLLISRMVLAGTIYALVLCRDHAFWRIPYQGWLVVTGLAFVAFLVALARARTGLRRAAIADVIGFEVIGVSASLITLVTPIIFWDVVFYHLIVWIVLPLRQLPGATGKLRFLAQTVALSTVFYCLTPAVNVFPALDSRFWLRQSELWGYFHITMSFAASAFNPRWISRWFVPRPVAVATAPAG